MKEVALKLLSDFSLAGLAAWLADFYLLATLLMLVALAARRWIRQPAQRLALNWVVAVELAALGVVCALPFWPRVSLRRAPVPKVAVTAPLVLDHDEMSRPVPMPRTPFPRMPAAVPGFDVPLKPDVGELAAPPVPAPAAPPRWSWIELVAVAYLVCAGLAVAWLFWGAAAAIRTCRCGEIAPLSLREELARIVGEGGGVPRLLVSSWVTTAVALGLRRPTILLPAGLIENTSPQALRVVLSHEWAHIRNGDLWLLAVGRCLLVLLFPHPLFWWLRRAIRGDQELLADAAAAGDNRPAYAEELLRLVRKSASRSPFAASPAVGKWESSSQLSRRIAMLLDENFQVESRAPRRWRYQALGLLAVFAAACSLVTLQPARSAGQPAQADSPRPYSGEGQGVRASDARSVPPNQKSGSGSTIAAPDNLVINAGRDDSIVPPVYRLHLLADPAVRKELNLTVDQVRKLKAIRAKFDVGLAESRKALDAAYRKSQKLPPAEAAKLIRKPANEWTRWMAASVKEARKQAEEVLTPEQRELLKEETFRGLAYGLLVDNPYARVKGLESLMLTKEQNDQVLLLRKELDDWATQHRRAMGEKTLSVLTPEEMARLRKEALGPLGPSDPLEPLTIHIKGEKQPYQVFSLAPYPDFTKATVPKELGLSAAQERQVQGVLGGSTNLNERLARDLEKLSPEERKKLRESSAKAMSLTWSAYVGDAPQERTNKIIDQRKNARVGFAEQPVMKPVVALRKQFEAVLTPEQLARFQDVAVRDFAAGAMDGTLLPMIGAGKEQQAEVAQFCYERSAKGPPFFRDVGRRLISILTPAQEKDLRAEIEKDLDEVENPRIVSDEPAPDSKATSAPGGVTFSGPAIQPAHDAKNTSANSLATLSGAGDNEGMAAKSDTGQTAPVATEKLDPSFSLPVYADLCQPDQRRRLGIELSADQLKKLREISTAWQSKLKELSKGMPKTTDQQELAKIQTAFQAKGSDLAKGCRKQIEAVLTPQQAEAYRQGKLDFETFNGMLLQNEYGNRFGITFDREQRQKLDAVKKDFLQKSDQKIERFITALLAVLSPRQRELLRPEVEKRILAIEDSLWSTALQSGPVDVGNGLMLNAVAPEAKNANMVQAERELGYKPVADKVGLNAAQQKQFSVIDAEHQKKTEEFVGEVRKLSPDQRKQPEVREKAARMRAETRRQIQDLLTPQQRGTLREYEFREWLPILLQETALPEESFGSVKSPGVQKRIALNDEQVASLRRVFKDYEIGEERSYRETGRRAFDVLTPQQQEKMIEVINKWGW